MSTIKVVKRDGTQEPLQLDKLHKVVEYACADLAGVSASEVELRSHLMFYDGISTRDIQESLIKAAAELISEKTPDYQFVAGRLVNYHLRKEVWGSEVAPNFFDHFMKVANLGFYDKTLLAKYTPDEWKYFGDRIQHDRDEEIPYVGMEQFRGKYLVKNRVTGQIFETPQIAYMLIAMTLFQDWSTKRAQDKSGGAVDLPTRREIVLDYYDAISQGYISLPTPIMAGVRTPQRQYSSCVLIESDDDLNSIFTTAHAIGLYVSQKAGIGIGGGKLRGLGSPIRNGDTAHTGVIPFFRLWQTSVKSCSQGGVRGGAATLHYPIWHIEVLDLLPLKNNAGTEFNRVRQLDYSVQFNKLMYERLIRGQNITLFSPKEVPGLYEAFFADQDEFKRLYEAAEADPSIKMKKTVTALEVFSIFGKERKDTGRLYLQNVDNANEQGAFLPSIAPIRQSNLCQEINLPTVPLMRIDDLMGEIALCILSALNFGLMRSKQAMRKYCRLAVWALDSLIDLQEYPVAAAEKSTRGRRPIGVGINNFAYWLVKNGLNYQDIDEKGLELIDEWMEAFSFYMIEASADLAQAFGACPLSAETKYSLGITPNRARKKGVDELVPYVERMEWDELTGKLATYGIRNSTTMALMPSETSSQVIPKLGSTNGIEPPRSPVSIKQSKDGVLPQVVPEVKRYGKSYDYLWQQKSPVGYLKIVSIMQKYIDQGISVNTSYNPEFYDGELPLSEILQHILLFYKWGGKQLYYHNTYDGAGEIDTDKQDGGRVESSASAQETEPDECSACVL